MSIIETLLSFNSNKISSKYFNTDYYNTYKNLVSLYNKFLYNIEFDINDMIQEVYKLGVNSTYITFMKHKKSVKSADERKQFDVRLGLSPDSKHSTFFNINRFNFEKTFETVRLTKLDIDSIQRVKDTKTKITDISTERFIKIFTKDNLYSNVVIIKNLNSSEY